MRLGFPILPSFLQITALPFCSESPRFLLINRKEEDGARKALQRSWGTQDVNREMKDESVGMSQGRQATVRSSVIPELPWPLRIPSRSSSLRSSLGPALCSVPQQESSKMLVWRAVSASTGASVAHPVFTAVSLFLMERAGRRTLHGMGLGGTASCSIVATLSVY